MRRFVLPAALAAFAGAIAGALAATAIGHLFWGWGAPANTHGGEAFERLGAKLVGAALGGFVGLLAPLPWLLRTRRPPSP